MQLEEQPDDFEWEEDFFGDQWEEHLEYMREGGEEVNELADFLEWAVTKVDTYKGVITDFEEMLDHEEQTWYEPPQAARYFLAMLLGTEWERKDPSPEFRDDIKKSEVLKESGSN